MIKSLKISSLTFLSAALLLLCGCSNTSKHHYVTVVSYDTLSHAINDCPVIQLFFTTGFNNNQLTVNWNNAIIYNGKITTDKIKGVALCSVTVPKNKGSIHVLVDGIELEKNIDTDYCNLVYKKSGDSLLLEFTNKHIQFD